jgi:hypothetical protein
MGKCGENTGSAFESLGKSKTWNDAGNATGDAFKSLGDKETWESLGNDTKKTWNAASAGIGNAVDSLGLPDVVWYFAGFVLVGGVFIYAVPENNSNKLKNY